jgi:hypothetical protein
MGGWRQAGIHFKDSASCAPSGSWRILVATCDMANPPDRSARPPRRGRARGPRSQLGLKVKPDVRTRALIAPAVQCLYSRAVPAPALCPSWENRQPTLKTPPLAPCKP